MFSKDEMRRAIEDALKSMEGVAFELYRRGREESREELEEARRLVDQLGTARDKAEAELRELQRSTSEALAQAVEWQREREEARADLREFVRQTEDAYALLKPLEEGSDVVERAVSHLLTVLRGRERPGPWAFDAVLRERDEAQAEVERLRAQYAATVLEHAKMLSEAVDVSKRQKRLADRAHDQACRLAAKLDAQSTDQFRRGAEAMREACARWIERECADERTAWHVARLPIPEEP